MIATPSIDAKSDDRIKDRIHAALMNLLGLSDVLALTAQAIEGRYNQWLAQRPTFGERAEAHLTLDDFRRLLADPSAFITTNRTFRVALPHFVEVSREFLYGSADEGRAASPRVKDATAVRDDAIEAAGLSETAAGQTRQMSRDRLNNADYAAQFFDLWPAIWEPMVVCYRKSGGAQSANEIEPSKETVYVWIADQISKTRNCSPQSALNGLKLFAATGGFERAHYKAVIARLAGTSAAALFGDTSPVRPKLGPKSASLRRIARSHLTVVS
jgi:hypothetical protein